MVKISFLKFSQLENTVNFKTLADVLFSLIYDCIDYGTGGNLWR
jgi:hypothetical protein